MKKEFIYRYRDKDYPGIVEEKDFLEGKSVRVSIFHQDGKVKSIIRFACHIEFKDYEYYQNKDISELMDIAIQRINLGIFDSVVNEDVGHVLEIFFRFNNSEMV